MLFAPFLIATHSLPIPSFYVEWTAMLCGLIALTVLFVRREARLELPRIVWLPLGLCALLLGQAWLGLVNYPSQAVLAVLYLLWATTLMLATRRLAQIWDAERLSEWLAWAVLAGGLINAAIAVLQLAKLDDLPFVMKSINDVIYGNMGQPNHFANFLALAWVSLLFLVAKGRMRLPHAGALGAALLLGLALSSSRSSWLYLLAVAALSLTHFALRKTPDSRLLVKLSLAALVVFYLFQLGLNTLGVATPIHRLSHLAASVPIRLALWQDGLTMFLGEPWLGVGYQQYAWQHFLHILDGSSPFASLPGYEGRYAEHAHNIIVQLLAEFGIGAALLLSWAGYRLFLILRNTASASQQWLSAMLIVLLIHSLLEYPLWYANFLGVAAVLLALADPRPFSFAIPTGSLRRLSALTMAMGMLVLGALWHGYGAIETMIFRWNNARTAQTVQFIQENLKTAQLASLLEPQLDAFLAGLPVDAQEREGLQERVALSAKVMRQMSNATTVYRHVAWLWMAGQKTEALALLEQAARAYPDSRAQNVEELRRMVTYYPEMQALLDAARSAQASASPRPASAATPAGAGMSRHPDYPATR